MSQLRTVISDIASKVAPQWPLPKWLAVNPFWHYRHQSVESAAAEWGYGAGIRLLMPASFYQQQFNDNAIDPSLVSAQDIEQLQQAVAADEGDTQRGFRWHNVSHLLDQFQQRRRKMLWHNEVVYQISQSCGLFMQFPRRFQLHGARSSLYQHWLTISRADRGIETLMDESELHELFAQLPSTPDELFQQCQSSFLQDASVEAQKIYVQSLLGDVFGWASALAYQDQQQGSQWVIDILAIRMAWDYLLWQLASCTNQSVFAHVSGRFKQQLHNSHKDIEQLAQQQQLLWRWQHAYEQSQLSSFRFKADEPAVQSKVEATLQAVFCIDVRSERYRRALEVAGAALQMPTQGKGFAGFFGVPVAKQCGHEVPTSHMPGLLNPSYVVRSEFTPAPWKKLLGRVLNSPVSMFTGVEALGFAKLKPLLTGVPGQLDVDPVDAVAQLHSGDRRLALAELADICAQALTGMQFEHYAEHIALVGHGAKHSNNAQRAGMNCGACGGQSGALSSQVLCQLLNRDDVRQLLQEQGFAIPASSRFYAALHETVADDIVWLSEEVPDEVKMVFKNATLSLQQHRNEPTENIYKRTKNWAELRPEWGLADNAVIYLGRSQRLADDNNQGRRFLHDYQAQHDESGELLAQLLSAPVLVSSWINWQYYCSVTEPDRLGSGNKLLHNRVANDLGVFEGNGGDLRLGLARQSVHDGNGWVHRPLRLQVIVEANRSIIERALEQADDFRTLWQNGWVALHELTPEGALKPVEC